MAQADRVTNSNSDLTIGGPSFPAEFVMTAHTNFIASVMADRPNGIPINPHSSDLELRADHLRAVLSAVSTYLSAVLTDTAQSVPGGLDLRQVDALLSDLVSEAMGAIQGAADDLAEKRQ